jgi:Spy/CpxP family protein refolding chaperone
MKKIFVLVAFFVTVFATTTNAQQQGGGDPAAMMARYKERVKPQLIEKTKLTDQQADKVLDINFESRAAMRNMRDLSDEDRKKKMDEVQADINKKYKALPLTDDQIKSVNAFFEEQRKNMQQRQGGNGGGNN